MTQVTKISKCNKLDNTQNKKVTLIFHHTIRHMRNETLGNCDTAVNMLNFKSWLL